MNDENIRGSTGSSNSQSRKRSYEQMSGESQDAISSFRRTRTSESSSRNSTSMQLPSSTPRFPGDGLDFRRPVMSTHPATQGGATATPSNIIDLTDDTEPSSTIRSDIERRLDQEYEQRRHFHRLSRVAQREGTAERPISVAGTHERTRNRTRSNSPEVHFLYERNVERTRRTPTQATERAARLPSSMDFSVGSLLTSRTNRAQHNSWNWLPLPNSLRYFTDTFTARPPTDPSFYSRRGSRRNYNPTEARFHAFLGSVGFEQPRLNFEAAAFALNPEPPSPTYEKPPAPREGFVRSPQEEDVLVCPNCGDELGASDDELKQQVWVVKACGHVYCGVCTRNRSKKGKARDPRLPYPFSKCVVDGCEKTKVSHHKAMFQLYIS